MFDRFIFVLLAIAVLGISQASVAGVDRWTPIGPVGAPITYIAADPRVASTLYASDGQHLFKTMDTGTTWRATMALPTPFEVTVTSFLCPTSYFIHPASGAIFATACYGLFRSTDGGNSSQTLSAPGAPFSVIGGDPSNGLVVYGLIGHPGEIGPSNGDAVKSTDGGATWAPLGLPSPNGGVTSIVADAMQPQILYAVGIYGVFRSTDGGAHWASANTGLPASSIVNLVQIGPKLVVAVDGYGVFVSTDQAATWSPSNIGLTDGRVVALVASPGSVSPLYLLAGLRGAAAALSSFRSVDDGATWTMTGPLVFGGAGLLGGPGLPLAAGPPSYVFTTTSTGMVISSDGQLTWHPLSTSSGLPNVPTQTMLVDSGDPTTLYAASFFNVGYRSRDRGAHWSELGLFLGNPPLPLAVSPARTGVVYGVSSDLVRSADYGDNWTDLFFLPRASAKTVRESPTNSNRVVFGANPFQGGLSSVPLVQTSDDSGATWKDASAGLPQGRLGTITIDPTDPQTMYAGVDSSVFKTTSGGNVWVSMSSGLGSAIVVDIAVNRLQPTSCMPQPRLLMKTSGTLVGCTSVSMAVRRGHSIRVWDTSVQCLALILFSRQRSTQAAMGRESSQYRRRSDMDGDEQWLDHDRRSPRTDDSGRSNRHAQPVHWNRRRRICADGGPAGARAAVIEYYAPQFDDYFITPVIDEIHVLDTQVIPGWYRTGYRSSSEPTPGADPLCRFYIPPASHFFSG